MNRTVLHKKYSKIKHLKKNFLVRNQKVSHVIIFGCSVYIHIPKEKRMKLDPLGKKGIFVGYSERSKDYRIYFQDSRISTSAGM